MSLYGQGLHLITLIIVKAGRFWIFFLILHVRMNHCCLQLLNCHHRLSTLRNRIQVEDSQSEQNTWKFASFVSILLILNEISYYNYLHQ